MIAKTQSIRQYRQLRAKPLLAAFQVLPLLIIIPAVVGRLPLPGYEGIWSAPGAYVYGTRFASGHEATVLELGRGAAGVLFLLVTYLVLLPKAMGNGGLTDEIDDHLAVVPTTTLAIAELLTYLAFGWRIVGPILLAAAIVFGAGAGTALTTVTIAFAGCVLFVTAAAAAYPIALALQLAFTHVTLLRENKLIVGGPLVIGMFAVFVSLRQSIDLLGGVPIGWYADLALISATAASPVRATVALIALPATVAASVSIAPRLGERLWLADEPSPAPSESAERNRSPVDELLGRVLSRPVAAVVRVTWRRLRREPRVLLFGGLLIVLTASAGLSVANRFPNGIPIIVAIYGAATVGVGVTLNPLGSEGRALGGTLTTPRGGQHVLTGYALSAAIPGCLLVGLASVAAGSLTELEPLTRAGLSVFGALFGAMAPVLSLGIGVALPQFDGIDSANNTGMQTPRLEAVFAFTTVIVALGLPAIVGLYGAPSLATGSALSPRVVAIAGPVTSLTLLAGASWFSYQYALTAVREREFAT
ncbi:hypothetical protein [Natronorubrum halophilum]|uniref:hypothetical protein n=1 Tax=Natronorubrum halophilum TaxID=1702106 RepID=UPI0010C209C3|nr:hypothetical protein [Natronorubrum halophilum]